MDPFAIKLPIHENFYHKIFNLAITKQFTIDLLINTSVYKISIVESYLSS